MNVFTNLKLFLAFLIIFSRLAFALSFDIHDGIHSLPKKSIPSLAHDYVNGKALQENTSNKNQTLIRYNVPKLQVFALPFGWALADNFKSLSKYFPNSYLSYSYISQYSYESLIQSCTNFSVALLKVLNDFEAIVKAEFGFCLGSNLSLYSSVYDPKASGAQHRGQTYIRAIKVFNRINMQKHYNVAMANSYNLGSYSIENACLYSPSLYEPLECLLDLIIEPNKEKSMFFGRYNFTAQLFNNSINQFMLPIALVASYENISKYITIYNYITKGEKSTELFYLYNYGDLAITPWAGYKHSLFGFLYTVDLFIKYKSSAFKISAGGNKSTKASNVKSVQDFFRNQENEALPFLIDYTVFLGITLGSFELWHDLLVEAQIDGFITKFHNEDVKMSSLDAYLAFTYPIFDKINAKLAFRYLYQMPILDLNHKKIYEMSVCLPKHNKGTFLIDVGLEFLI